MHILAVGKFTMEAIPLTNKQKQHLLAYLGYYVGNIDGKWGQMSETATKAFQKDYGITADGICGKETEKALKHAVSYGMPAKNADEKADFWADIKHFKREEFRCKCGGKYCNGYPTEIDMDTVKIADAIRERIGKPIAVNSGIRCKTHNANVGGVSNSQHLYGKAADLCCPSGYTPSQMASIAEEIMGNTGGIGIYSWGIHIDTRSTKSRWNG